MNVFLVLIFFGSLNDICDGCNVGYYGKSCSDLCPDNCHDNECNATTGKCLSCVKGHYSNNTKDCVRCPGQCTACSSDKFCFACNSGFRGEVCENECKNCRPNTSCDKNTGYCFENCSDGLSGELCNIPCDSKCKSCDRHDTGQCISCADDENGHACKKECFNKCLRNMCNESYGSCSVECISGYMTDKTCSRTCLAHCKDRCTFQCKDLVPQNIPSPSTSKTNIGLIVGLVFGSIAVCLFITVFIIVRRRRKKRSNCCYSSSNRTQDQETTSTIHNGENIELLSQESRRTTETREFLLAEKLTALHESFSAIENKYCDMKITVAGNKVTITGIREDIEKAFKEIDIKCDEIKHAVYRHSKSRECLNFYTKKQTIEYVQQKLKQKQFLGTWNINGTELTVFVFGTGSIENFKNIVLESVLEISATVDQTLLTSVWFGEFLIDIKRLFQEKVDIYTQEQQEIVIICTDDVVKQVTNLVKEFLNGTVDAVHCEPVKCEFISQYWKQDDYDEIRKDGVMIIKEANGFELRGLLDKLETSKQKLNKKLQAISSKPYERRGLDSVFKHSETIIDIAKEFRCVIKLPQKIDECPSLMLCDHEVIDSEILEENQKDSSIHASTIYFQTRRHKIKIQLIQGDICHQKADIIVLEAASNLDLQSNSALDSLMQHCYQTLQTDYNRLYPNGIQDGEVAVIDSGNFRCDKIYLTSLPPWKDARCNGVKKFRNFMRECLRLADKCDKKTIAFSNMVTGAELDYPLDLAVSIMYGAVVEFDSSYSKTSLKEIKIVMQKEDDMSLKTYRMNHLKKQAKENRHKRIFIDGTVLIKPEEDSKFGMFKDGCAIGPIQLHVQVGDILNNTADAIVIGVGANCNTNEQVLKKDEIIKTPKDELETKNVINVLLQDSLSGWRAKLVDCLEAASQKSFQSIAVPLLKAGTGRTTFPADSIGACLFAAIDDFTSQNPNSSVTDVRLVVDNSIAACVPAIIAAFQNRTTAVNFRWGIGNMFYSKLGCVADFNQFNESSITVYSDATINIDRCIKSLDDRIGLEYATRVVDADKDAISCFKVKEVKSFVDSDIMVDVTFDEHASKFTISGLLRNVMTAVTCLQTKMRHYNSAKALYDQTKWHWQCEDRLELVKEVPYDMMSNFVIETAYRKGKPTVELQSKDGKIYEIDFQKLVEYPKINISDTVMVIRKDIIKDVKNWFSKKWAAMNNNENVKRVVLDDGKESQKVKKLFLGKEKNNIDSSKDTGRFIQVVKIERIQNKTLYEQYQAKKKMMKQQKGRELWHETAEDNILRIINYGFNRSYCRYHETLYGQGVYFSADASYSAQTNLAGNMSGVKRYMFLAKVLTGELIKGHPSLRVHPLVNPDHPEVTYDSAVDDVNNPMQFVIFHDKQAYPEYLITYTST